MKKYLGLFYGDDENIAQAIYGLIRDRLRVIFNDDISEDIIKIIMIITSDKYDGDRSSAKNDL